MSPLRVEVGRERTLSFGRKVRRGKGGEAEGRLNLSSSLSHYCTKINAECRDTKLCLLLFSFRARGTEILFLLRKTKDVWISVPSNSSYIWRHFPCQYLPQNQPRGASALAFHFDGPFSIAPTYTPHSWDQGDMSIQSLYYSHLLGHAQIPETPKSPAQTHKACITGLCRPLVQAHIPKGRAASGLCTPRSV